MSTVDIEILLPSDHMLQCSLLSSVGDVTIKNLRGNVKLSSLCGDCKISNLIGNGDVLNVSGNVNIVESKGNIRFRSGFGKITCTDIIGNIDVITESGDVKLNRTKGEVIIKTNKGKLELESEIDGDTSNINTSLGDVSATFTNDNITVDLVSDPDICTKTIGSEYICNGKTYNASTYVKGGNEGAQIKIKTQRGDINLN